MRNKLRKPCNDCPFRRRSLPGWLGPWEPMELILSLKMTPFPCHQTIPSGLGTVPFDSPEARNMELCAGAAMFLNNKVELSRCPETAQHQQLIKDQDSSRVFSREQEFIDHHTQFQRAKEG